MTHPQPFNQESFMTLYRNRLFTAEQVCDIVASHSSAPVPESQEIDEWCKLHEEILKDIKTEAYRSGYYEGELIRDKLEQSIRQDALDDFINKVVSSRFELDGEIVVRMSDVRVIREDLRQEGKQEQK